MHFPDQLLTSYPDVYVLESAIPHIKMSFICGGKTRVFLGSEVSHPLGPGIYHTQSNMSVTLLFFEVKQVYFSLHSLSCGVSCACIKSNLCRSLCGM
jgi:hypothetical protein